MWLFTPRGFVSAVADADNPDVILVRSRFRGHLQEIFGRPLRVQRTPEADYLFRARIPRMRFEAKLAELARQVDYRNFKAAIAPGEIRYRWLCHRVWEMMVELQVLMEAGKQ